MKELVKKCLIGIAFLTLFAGGLAHAETTDNKAGNDTKEVTKADTSPNSKEGAKPAPLTAKEQRDQYEAIYKQLTKVYTKIADGVDKLQAADEDTIAIEKKLLDAKKSLQDADKILHPKIEVKKDISSDTKVDSKVDSTKTDGVTTTTLTLIDTPKKPVVKKDIKTVLETAQKQLKESLNLLKEFIIDSN